MSASHESIRGRLTINWRPVLLILISLLHIGIEASPTFEIWTQQIGIPEGNRLPQDVNGPLRLTNLHAYAYGLDPLSAPREALPRMVGRDAEGNLLIFYRMNTKATDLQMTLELSEDLETWSTVHPISETVSWSENGIEGRQVTVPWDSGSSGIIRHTVRIVTREPVFVNIPAGEIPEYGGFFRAIVISQAYSISKYEVTGKDWETVTSWAVQNGYTSLASSAAEYCNETHPVVNVTWYDAVIWCNAKSEMEGLEPVYYDNASGQNEIYRGPPYGAFLTATSVGAEVISWNTSKNGYRLPTHDEWEYAARGGQATNNYLYSGSDDIDAVSVWSENSFGAECDMWDVGTPPNPTDDRGTWPAGSKAPNELGLYDMSGNVWEMLYYPSFSGEPLLQRGHRAAGASWLFSEPLVSTFTSYQPVQKGLWLGFRIARTLFE